MDLRVGNPQRRLPSANSSLHIVLLTLLLMSCGTKSTDSELPANPGNAAQDSRPQLNAKQIFAFVEHVQADPNADRARAEAYLQKVLDGKAKPPNHGCNGRFCTKDADCKSEECPDGFCGGGAGTRLCVQL